MKKTFLLALMLLQLALLSAQNKSSFEADDFKKDANYGYFNYFQLMLHAGANPTGNEYLQQVYTAAYKALELRIGTQSTGRQLWQQYHNYPQYGLGFYIANLGGPAADTVIGTPSAVFFYFGAPWARFGNFSLNTDLSIGLTYDLKPYDKENNPYQTDIGSKINVYFNLAFLIYYKLSESIDLDLGVSLSHYSNGRMFTPQAGVNPVAINLGVKYNFNPIGNYTKKTDPDYKPNRRPEFIKSEWPEFKPHHELSFMAALGTVETPDDRNDKDEGLRYMTSSMSADWAYQFARKMNAGAGLDVFYDGSLVEWYPDWTEDYMYSDYTVLERMSFGVHGGFQYQMERFSFLYNFGVYIYKESPARGSWYMRAGGRIQVTENLYAHVVLKTMNGGKSDWVEWGMAYRLKVGKKNK